jgi:hypothetical protein
MTVESAGACERCGRSIEVEKIGESARALCVVCGPLVSGKAERERALAGSPYETALKKEVTLPEVWV